jgi:uncharacterized protein DUF4365
MSYAYVHSITSYTGFACDRLHADYDSIDIQIRCSSSIPLTINTKFHFCTIFAQIKSTSALERKGHNFTYDLKRKNYEDLKLKSYAPRLLVVYSMPAKKDIWISQNTDSLLLRHCAYWSAPSSWPKTTGNKYTTRIYIPHCNVFSPSSLLELMKIASAGKTLPRVL